MRVEPKELAAAIRDCRQALVDLENVAMPVQQRLQRLNSAATRACRALTDLRSADEFWDALRLRAQQRQAHQQLDIDALFGELDGLHENDHTAFGQALEKWGYEPPPDGHQFVCEQLGQLVRAVRFAWSRPGGILRGRREDLDSRAEAAVKVLQEQTCGGEEKFKRESTRLIQRAKLGGAVVSAIGAGLKSILGGIAGGSLMVLSVLPRDLYPLSDEDERALGGLSEEARDGLFVLGLWLMFATAAGSTLGSASAELPA